MRLAHLFSPCGCIEVGISCKFSNSDTLSMSTFSTLKTGCGKNNRIFVANIHIRKNLTHLVCKCMLFTEPPPLSLCRCGWSLIMPVETDENRKHDIRLCCFS